MDNNAKEILDRSGKLFGKKQDLDDLCQELAEHFYPERADFTSPLELGDDYAAHLYDSFPVLARRELGDAFAAMLRPRDKPWFLLTVDDDDIAEDTEAQRWLERATKILRRALYDPRATFVEATKRCDHDYATFGNGVLMLDELPTKDGMSWRVYHFRDCAWLENAEGKVDVMYRKAKPTARTLKQRFGEAKLAEAVQKACKDEPDKEINIVHCVMPAQDYDYIGKDKKKPNVERLPFVSVFVDQDNNRRISEEPLDSFRYVPPRWERFGFSQYGFSPAAMTSLPDARQLQAMARVLIEAGEKRVDPPGIIKEETVKGEVNLYAGGLTYVDRDYDEKIGKAVEFLEMGKDVGLGLEMAMRTQSLIAKAWFTNKLGLPEKGDKTAYETSILYEQFIREVTPLFEPSEQGYNALMLDEAFGFLQRRGGFGPVEQIPQTLQGREITYRFVNPLQDSIERGRVYTYLGALDVVEKAALSDPSQRDHLNLDKGTPDAIKGLGAPSKWLRTDEELEAVREERAKQEQMQQTIGAMQAGGEAIQTLADASQSVSVAMNPQLANQTV